MKPYLFSDVAGGEIPAKKWSGDYRKSLFKKKGLFSTAC